MWFWNSVRTNEQTREDSATEFRDYFANQIRFFTTFSAFSTFRFNSSTPNHMQQSFILIPTLHILIASPFRIPGVEVKREAADRSETKRLPPSSSSSSPSLAAATWSEKQSQRIKMIRVIFALCTLHFAGSDCNQHLRSLHGGTLWQQHRLANMVILCVGWGEVA